MENVLKWEVPQKKAFKEDESLRQNNPKSLGAKVPKTISLKTPKSQLMSLSPGPLKSKLRQRARIKGRGALGGPKTLLHVPALIISNKGQYFSVSVSMQLISAVRSHMFRQRWLA